MEAILKDINAVIGVTGSYVTDGAGHLLARALPEVFDAQALELVARNLVQTYSGLEATRRRKVGDIDLVFADGRLIAKRAGDGLLCIVSVKKMNVPLLNLTANVAVRRLNERLKPPTTAKKEARTVATAKAAPPLAPAAEAAPAAAPTVEAALAAAPTVEAAPAASQPPVAAPDIPRIQEAQAIIRVARERKIQLRAMGDTAIRMRCPSAAGISVPPEEDFLQLAGHRRQAGDIEKLLKEQGCTPDPQFNVLYGGQRLRFVHSAKKLFIEVVLDELSSFHRLEFGARLHLDEWTLTPADLFLCQIQVVHPGGIDRQRTLALLTDFEIGGAGELRAIDGGLVSGLCGEDWGWYKTVTMNLAEADAAAGSFQGGRSAENIQTRVRRLTGMIEEAPKSLRWQVRARVGDRQTWYEVPE
jgi:predicted regulator of Ras-like GTPase activity (Roadblock/LC7/MglB family)